MPVVPRAASAWPSKTDAHIVRCCVTGDRSQRYIRNRRIVKTDEFSSVFRLRPTYRTAHFVLYTRQSGLPQARLGVVVAKRLAPRAVTRNTIKRATRELFRQSALTPMDCIVRLSKPLNSRADPATSRSMKSALRTELQQLFSSLHLPDSQ